MNLFTALVIGVLIGWLASLVMGTDHREGLIRNVAVAIGGAYVGGWLLRRFFESGSEEGFSLALALASLFGAAALLYLVNRFSRA